MIDIQAGAPGQDLQVFDTQIFTAKNILSVQMGTLVYAPDLGIDLKYFLSEEFSFQNESFKSYLIQVLSSHSINVASIQDAVQSLYSKYTFNLTPSESSKSLMSR